MLNFFQTEFQMDEKEVTTLMGAHTLGRSHQEHSGYSGPFILYRKGYLFFNTQYYKNLLDNDIEYRNGAVAKDSNVDKKWQWNLLWHRPKVGGDGPKSRVVTSVLGSYLNTDMHLVYDIDLDPLDGTTCYINDRICHAISGTHPSYYSNKQDGKRGDGVCRRNDNLITLARFGFKLCQICQPNQ